MDDGRPCKIGLGSEDGLIMLADIRQIQNTEARPGRIRRVPIEPLPLRSPGNQLELA